MLAGDIRHIVKSQEEQLVRVDHLLPRTSVETMELLPGFATIISGVRRSGKSSLLRMVYQGDPANYTYLHFDDPRLLEFALDDFTKLHEMFPGTTFMLDEVHRVFQWEAQIRHLTEQRRALYVTGSNASMLSSEMASLLSGRHLSYELFPFSFAEFLVFTEHEADASALKEYLRLGGFAEFLRHRNPLILQSLFTDILERDIVARYQIRSAFTFKQLALYLINNIARPYSLRKLTKLLGVGSPTTVASFLHYLEDAYLFFSVPKFTHSFKKQLVNPKKIYGIDNGLILANTSKVQEDKGRLLENAIFLTLRRRSKEIFYHQQSGECDFVVRNADQTLSCYQVCYELHHDNYQREVDGLLDALNHLNLAKGYLISFAERDQIVVEDKVLEIVPALAFFLSH